MCCCLLSRQCFLVCTVRAPSLASLHARDSKYTSGIAQMALLQTVLVMVQSGPATAVDAPLPSIAPNTTQALRPCSLSRHTPLTPPPKFPCTASLHDAPAHVHLHPHTPAHADPIHVSPTSHNHCITPASQSEKCIRGLYHQERYPWHRIFAWRTTTYARARACSARSRRTAATSKAQMQVTSHTPSARNQSET